MRVFAKKILLSSKGTKKRLHPNWSNDSYSNRIIVGFESLMSDIYSTKWKPVFLFLLMKVNKKSKTEIYSKIINPVQIGLILSFAKAILRFYLVVSILFGYNLYLINLIFPTWSYLAVIFFHPKSFSEIWHVTKEHVSISQVSVNSAQECELSFLSHVSFFSCLSLSDCSKIR